MSHLIVIKYIKRDNGSYMDILVDKDMNSLILVLPNDLSKRFSLVSGVKGVYRADMDNFDQDFLTILKGVRSLRWHTISSHAILHPNNSEETRFYMERELHRNLPHGDVSSTAAAQIGEDGKLKRPTLSPDAVAGLLGNNNTPSSAPFGFSQRQSVTIRRPGPAPPVEPSSTESAVHPPSHPPAHAGSAPAPSSSSVANQLPPTPSHPVHPAQSNTVAHPPAHAVPVSSKNAPPISPAVADQKPAPVPGTNSNTSSAIAGLAQRFLVRATSSPAISANMAAPSSTSATTHASQPTSNAQVPAASANDAKNVDSKSSNSAVVSKLLGKYNRKSFISTGKIVVPPTVDENESKEDISQNNDTAADHVIAPHATSEVSSTNKPATLPPPPYEQVSQEAPPSYEAIHSLPATPSGGASLETFLNEHAMQVEDHPDIPSPMNSGRHQEDSQVHFNRSDLMSKYPSIQREPSNAHETSKHHHYSRLGAAFVNESSLNSLMGRGRGGRFGGRSGRGFSSSV